VPKIFYSNVKFRLGKTSNIKDWIVQVIRSEGKKAGDLSFFFVDDREIEEINSEFLKNNYSTDVIAFNYGKGDIISGEVYMSIDTIKRNSKIYRTKFKEEILRVMIHGVLHLIGYKDKEEIEKGRMKEKEDYYLERIIGGS